MDIQVSQYHRDKTRTVESTSKAFYYRRSISPQARIFNPAIASKLTGEIIKKNRAKFRNVQTVYGLRKLEFLLYHTPSLSHYHYRIEILVYAMIKFAL